MTAGLRSRLPTSLTGRLVVTVVTLVAVVGLVVTASTTLLLRGYLMHDLDERLRAAALRADEGPMSGAGGRDFDVRPADQEWAGPGPGGPHDRDESEVLQATFGATGPTVLLFRAGAPYAEQVPLTDAELGRLRDVPADEEPQTVSVGDEGTFRVLTRTATIDGSAVRRLTGVPASSVRDTVVTMLWIQLSLTGAAVAIAGLAGFWVVRRTLRPLRDVAQTAHEVTRLPLDTGEVGETARVPDRLTDPGTEVGQVGAALNRLLGHVEGALDARHRSEQQVRQFVADASHELRTPLATIMGYAELARRSPSHDPGDALVKVEEEGVRMRALVEDLLLLARLDAGRPLAHEQVDLTKLALESVEDARVVGGDHQWLLDLPEEPVTVTGDGQRLHQVLNNLLTNARRHTPPGTTVRVGLSTVPGAGDDRAVLTVADNGPGIPAELLPEVFERFTRADTSRTRDSGGAGLGLALVHAIVGTHGGSVSVESSPLSTVVRVSLPLG